MMRAKSMQNRYPASSRLLPQIPVIREFCMPSRKHTLAKETFLPNELNLCQPQSQRLGKLLEARDWYQKSLNIWTTIANPARLSISGVEATLPDEVSRRLAKCNLEIKALSGSAN